MKIIRLSLVALSLLIPKLHAEEALEAQIVKITVCSPMPNKMDAWALGLNEPEGTTLTFLVEKEQVVSVDEGSLKLNGWTLSKDRSSARITDKMMAFSIHNKFFQDDPSSLELDGSIILNVGTEILTKELKLKKGDPPVKFPDFTVERDENENGVTIKGTIGMMNKIKVESKGKELHSNGSSSSGEEYTHYYDALDDDSKITISYYSKIEKKTVKITK